MPDTKTPLLSVVIPVFNGEEYVGTMIDCFRAQEGDDFDPCCHEAEDGAASGVIADCLCPGVTAGTGGEVLEKALVRLK